MNLNIHKDEIMVLFGAPATHENDPERALRAALEMMDALTDFNTRRGTDLGLHFDLNIGLVIAGGIGTDEAQGQEVVPGLQELVGTGRVANTPSLDEMWTAWRMITAAADQYLDKLVLQGNRH